MLCKKTNNLNLNWCVCIWDITQWVVFFYIITVKSHCCCVQNYNWQSNECFCMFNMQYFVLARVIISISITSVHILYFTNILLLNAVYCRNKNSSDEYEQKFKLFRCDSLSVSKISIIATKHRVKPHMPHFSDNYSNCIIISLTLFSYIG